jgi:hypothetical protein
MRSGKLPPFLGVTKRANTALSPDDYVYDNIIDVPVDSGVSAGIRWRSFAGLVPTFEEQMVRVECGYKLEEWADMPAWDKAIEIATSRIRRAIEAHETQAQSDAMDSKVKK